MGERCHRIVISSGECAEVARCECGHLHVSLGPLTVRLEEHVLRSLFETLKQTVAVLDRTRERAGCFGQPPAPGMKQ